MIPHSKPTIGPEETAAVAEVLQSGRLAQGREVERFERECAGFCGRRHAVAVSSGTAALHLALAALGIEREEPVAVPSYCCAALITAIDLKGARPRLIDIGPDYNLDAEAVTGRDPETAAGGGYTGCPAAIVPSMFGAPAQVPKGSAAIIEDVAQAFGGPAGHTAPIAITSFYATKLMTTGEGGMLFTDDDAIAECVRDVRDYDNRDDFKTRYAYKMTDFQAAMGLCQLKKLPEFLRRRREVAEFYSERLRDLPLELPRRDNHLFFRYVVATDRRDELEAWLQAHGIESKRPVYRPAHHYLGGAFPNSERAHQQCLSLPIYPRLSNSEADLIASGITDYFEKQE